MHIILYRTKLCPRCFLAKTLLFELTLNIPDVHIEEREVMLSPLQTLREGILLIPAIKMGEKVLSGIFLDRKKISEFLQTTGCLPGKIP